MPNKTLDSFIDIKPAVDGEIVEVQIETRTRETNTETPTEQDFVDDFNYARSTLHDLIESGTKALNGAMVVATSSQHPRAFEVASTLIGQVSSAAKDLLSLTETAAKITPPAKDDTEEGGFTGSTKSLNALLDEENPIEK